MKLAAFAVIATIAGCSSAPRTPASLVKVDGGALGSDSESARFILTTHCGVCHRGDLPDHKPAAVAIFDLSKVDWSSKMTPHQLEAAPKRLSASDREEQLFGEFIRA